MPSPPHLTSWHLVQLTQRPSPLLTILVIFPSLHYFLILKSLLLPFFFFFFFFVLIFNSLLFLLLFTTNSVIDSLRYYEFKTKQYNLHLWQLLRFHEDKCSDKCSDKHMEMKSYFSSSISLLLLPPSLPLPHTSISFSLWKAVAASIRPLL